MVIRVHPRWTSGNQAGRAAALQALPLGGILDARGSSAQSARGHASGPRPGGSASTPWLGSALRQAFDGHGHDVVGLVAIVAGVVVGLGDLRRRGRTGRPRRGRPASARSAGLRRWLVPPALVALGRHRDPGPARRGRAGRHRAPGPRRSWSSLVGACGLLDLVRGSSRAGATRSTPSSAPAAPSARRRAGDWRGWSVRGPPASCSWSLCRRRRAAGDPHLGARRRRPHRGRRPSADRRDRSGPAPVVRGRRGRRARTRRSTPPSTCATAGADDGSTSDADDGSDGFSVTVAGAEATARSIPTPTRTDAERDPARSRAAGRHGPTRPMRSRQRPPARDRPRARPTRPSAWKLPPAKLLQPVEDPGGRPPGRGEPGPGPRGGAGRATASRPAWSAWWSARP